MPRDRRSAPSANTATAARVGRVSDRSRQVDVDAVQLAGAATPRCSRRPDRPRRPSARARRRSRGRPGASRRRARRPGPARRRWPRPRRSTTAAEASGSTRYVGRRGSRSAPSTTRRSSAPVDRRPRTPHHRDGHVDVRAATRARRRGRRRSPSRVAGADQQQARQELARHVAGTATRPPGEARAVRRRPGGDPARRVVDRPPPSDRSASMPSVHRPAPQRRGAVDAVAARRRARSIGSDEPRRWCPTAARRASSRPAGRARPPTPSTVDRGRRRRSRVDVDARAARGSRPSPRCRRRPARRRSAAGPVGQRGADEGPVGDALRPGHTDRRRRAARRAARSDRGSGQGGVGALIRPVAATGR